jgi:hypothetical protein
LEFAEQHAAASGVGELRLYTDTRMDRNIAIYRHCGFIEVGTRPIGAEPEKNWSTW